MVLHSGIFQSRVERAFADQEEMHYCDNVKNVTVSLDDETYRQARRRAAQADRSLSSVVREFLQAFGAEESEFDRLAREERDLRAEIVDFSGEDRLSREDLHERAVR